MFHFNFVNSSFRCFSLCGRFNRQRECQFLDANCASLRSAVSCL